MCQLLFLNYRACANYIYTIVVPAPPLILQMSYLRQSWFYNCYIAPIIILQWSNLRQLWFCNCPFCASYVFKISILAPIIFFYICHTCANYDFTIFILAPIMILKFLYLRQFWFYNYQIWANYNFTTVILAPLMILNCQTWANHYFTIVKLVPIISLQLSYLRQLNFHICHTCGNYDFKIFILVFINFILYDFTIVILRQL